MSKQRVDPYEHIGNVAVEEAEREGGSFESFVAGLRTIREIVSERLALAEEELRSKQKD